MPKLSLLGRHCGLRINEAFGLKWCNVDLENGTITIDRQMQYQKGIIKLVAPKTRNSRRTIYMSDVLRDHLIARAKMLEAEAQKLAAIREQKQRFIDDIDGKKMESAIAPSASSPLPRSSLNTAMLEPSLSSWALMYFSMYA